MSEIPLAESYSISKREFSGGFLGWRKIRRERLKEIEKYTFGERVTRGNFVATLIDSFRVSRGYPVLQNAYFGWLKTNTGFDYARTILNYSDAGGYNSLSSTEQNTIKAAYAKAPHVRLFDEQKFDTQVEQNSEFMASGWPSLIPADELQGMPARVFLQRIHEHYRVRAIVFSGIKSLT
jgi:hypothetical protein